MTKYIVHLGWLKNNGYNDVEFQDTAMSDLLRELNGAALYADDQRNHRVGVVSVVENEVYVDILKPVDLSGLHPAIAVGGIAKRKKGGGFVVESVSYASLFLTKDDNGNRLESIGYKQ